MKLQKSLIFYSLNNDIFRRNLLYYGCRISRALKDNIWQRWMCLWRGDCRRVTVLCINVTVGLFIALLRSQDLYDLCFIYIYNIYAFSSLTKCINHLNRQNRQRSFFVSPDKTRLVLLTTSLNWAALCSFFAIINVTNVLAFQSKILKKTICTKLRTSLYLKMASF